MLHGYGGRRRRKPKATESAEGRNKLPGVVDQQVNVTAGGEHAARRRKIEDEVPSILEPKLRGSRPEAPCLSKTRDRPIGKGEIPVAVGPGRGRITRPADGTAATRADVRQRLRRLPRRPADTTDEHRRRRHGPEEIQEPTRRWARAPERRPATDREIGGGGYSQRSHGCAPPLGAFSRSRRGRRGPRMHCPSGSILPRVAAARQTCAAGASRHALLRPHAAAVAQLRRTTASDRSPTKPRSRAGRRRP